MAWRPLLVESTKPLCKLDFPPRRISFPKAQRLRGKASSCCYFLNLATGIYQNHPFRQGLFAGIAQKPWMVAPVEAVDPGEDAS
jgi:hypothetical protein